MNRSVLWLMVWLVCAVAALFGGSGIMGCHNLPAGGTVAMGGRNATGGDQATGGTSSPVTVVVAGASSVPIFPACEPTDTGAMLWSAPVPRALGWHRPTAIPQSPLKSDVAGLSLHSVLWQPNDLYSPDQGDVRSCVGRGWNQATAAQPFSGHTSDDGAEELYHWATTFDQFEGTWRPDDTGSTVFAGGQAAVHLRQITGFHCVYTVSEALQLLMVGPGVIGTDWLEGMFSIDNCGHLDVSGVPVGGHARALVAYDHERGRTWELGSWGQFGISDQNGRDGWQYLTLPELERLFRSGGEACFPNVL